MAEPVRCPINGALEVDRENAHCATYLCRIPREHTFDDVLAPEYFGRKQNRTQQDRLIREGDFIDVQPEDFSWYARLMVRARLPDVDQVVTDVIYHKIFSVGDLPAGWSMDYRGARAWVIMYRGHEKDGGFKTSEAAKHRIGYFVEQGMVDGDAAPKNKGGRPKKATADEQAKEPETV